MENKIINFRTTVDRENGSLSFFEALVDVPFQIKRVYFTYNVPLGVKRGMHAHKQLEQVIWCPFGSIEVVLDNGFTKEIFILNSADKGLLVQKGFWREMIWKQENSVLCVAASDYYSEEDYIRNYDDFTNYVKKGYSYNEN